MQMSFRVFAVIVVVLFSGLAGVWLFFPQLLLGAWGVDYTAAVGLVGRRGAGLYLGIAVMFFLARNAEPSVARTALTVGLGIECLTLAALGMIELISGGAGLGILSAVIAEALLVAGAVHIWRRDAGVSHRSVAEGACP